MAHVLAIFASREPWTHLSRPATAPDELVKNFFWLAWRLRGILANADGFLTQEELKAAHEAYRAEMKAKWAEKADGKEPRKPKAELDPAKAEAWKAKKAEREDKMAEKSAERFAAADTDSDGRWNQAEYVAHRLEPFAKVDTDGDGNITAAEQEAAKAKMKEKRGKWRDKPADQ